MRVAHWWRWFDEVAAGLIAIVNSLQLIRPAA